MASRNVDLLIRARDNASRAFKSVSDSLDELAKVQADVAGKTAKVDDALNKSQSSAKKMATAIGGDVAKGVEKAAKVFERIEQTVADSSSQFEKQKQDLRENKEAYTALGKQAEAAAAAIKRSEDKIGPQTEEQTARLKSMRDAYRGLTQEIGKMTPKLAKQENSLEQNAAELDRIRNAAIAASAALKEVGRTSATAQGLSGQKSQTDAANQAAQKGLANLAKAERAIQIEINAREEAARAAAAASEAANQQIVSSVQDVIQSEKRLAAIQAQRTKMQAAEGANASAKAGLAGVTAGLIGKSRAEEAASRAAEAHGRAMAALESSYARQRAAARPSVGDQKALAQAFRASFTAAQQAKTPIEQLYQEITRLGPAADQGANGMRRLSGQMTNGRQAFRAFYGDSRKALSLMQRIRGEVLSLTASFVGFYGVFNVGQGIFQAFTKLEAAQNRLGAAFNQDYGKVNDEMDRLQDEAARLGISFDVLADNYSKFIISGQQAGLGVAELRTTFTQVAEAGRVLKLSNDQIEGTFNALIQIAGKGTLQMEELRQQLGDRIPGAVGIMAKALGYGEDQLAQFYKDVENGVVSADAALRAFGSGLDATFGDQLEDALDSTITKVGELQNLFFQRQLTAANSGFITGLDTALEALNEFLASEQGIEFFEELGAAFGKVFETLPVVLDNLDTLGTLLQGFIAIKAGQVVSQLAGNFANLGRMTIANARVQVALNRTVAAFSPSAAAALRSTTALGVGLRGLRAAAAGVIVTMRAAFLSLGGIIGIAAAALSYFAFNSLTAVDDAGKTTSETLEAHADIVRDVKAAYDEAEGSADKFKEKLDALSKIEAQANLKKLRDELKAFKDDDSNTYSGMRGSAPETRAMLQERGDELGVRGLVDDLLKADEAFTKGEGSAKDMLKAIQAVNDASPDFLPIEIQERIEKIAKSGVKMEDSIGEAEAVLRVLNGTATDADKILLGLQESTESAAEAGKRAAKKFSAFEEAMRELAKLVPSLNEELERFDAIKEIEVNFQNALKAAQALPDAIMRIAAAQEALQTKELALAAADGETISGGLASRIIGVESGGDPSAKNPDSTATGLGQFIESTWLRMFKQYFPEQAGGMSNAAILELRKNATISREMVNLYLKENAAHLRKAGAAVTDANLYLAHFLGPGGAAKLINSAPGTLASDVLGADQVNANKSILQGKSREEVIGWAQRKVGVSDSEMEIVEATAEVRRKAAEEAVKAAEKLAETQAEFRKDQAEGIAQTEFEIGLEGKRLVEAEVAKALRDAELEAKKAGIVLTQQELDTVEKLTRAKFATKQAEEDRNTKLEEANALEEKAAILADRRRFLLEQITQMEGQADLTGVARTQEELEAVEAQLESALQKAIAFWEAMGGPGSEAAILALQTTQQELRNTESTAIATGKQINTMIADRATSALDNFAKRVANGENALSAFKDEFAAMAADILRQLAMMIIKQLIFNAISGMFGGGAGGGGGLGGVIAGGMNKIFHSGGVATDNSPSSGRSISPAVFANAVRYHSGGIAGLAPDEMGAILKKNEEVLTEEDPRHRFNGGASGGSGQEARPFKIVNAFDAPGFLEAAMSSDSGGEVLLNYLKANSDTVKAALG